MKNTDFSIGKRLNDIKKRYGLSARQMAELMGVPLPSLNNWLYDYKAMPAQRLYELALRLDFSLDFFFLRTDDPDAHKKSDAAKENLLLQEMRQIEKKVDALQEKLDRLEKNEGSV